MHEETLDGTIIPDLVKVLDLNLQLTTVDIEILAMEMTRAKRLKLLELTKGVLNNVMNYELENHTEIKRFLFNYFKIMNQERFRILQKENTYQLRKIAKELGIEVEEKEKTLNPYGPLHIP